MKSSFLLDMFSETSADGRSHISSKRVVGTIIIMIVMSCTMWLVWKEGGTDVVENLLQTAMIISASLLGISSVTGIWKGNSFKASDDSVSVKKVEPNEEKPKCPYLNQ